jgi:uncharacterized repeat protein (TIGR03806 family)
MTHPQGRVAHCALALVGTLLTGLFGAHSARAQICATGPRVPFAGHTFPLDGLPVPSPMQVMRAYPNLTLDEPVFLASPPDGTGRIFVVEKTGRIRILPSTESGNDAPTFLDLSSEIATSYVEQGLLGLAFDPGFAANRRLYVYYVAPGSSCTQADWCTKVESYRASTTDPNQVEPGSRLELLQIARVTMGHNSGMLAFGPDGMLYISSGDDFIPENGQDLSTLKGKILRIDPSGGTPYAIPTGNPFVAQAGARAEIWAYGFRNPWRLSFDRATGDLWIGDVGEHSWEEVDYVAAGTAFERNFGWPICEGTHDLEGDCSALVSTLPVIEYPHDASGGFSVTGGYVYRGDRLPSLYGAYVYADHVSGRIWARGGPAAPSIEIANLQSVTSFGEDSLGELHLLELGGGIYRLEESDDGGSGQFPTTLSGTGLFSNVANLTPAPGLIEYEVNSPLWSDRALKKRWIALPGTQRIGFSANADWVFPTGTVFVKHFELPTSASSLVRVETRVLLRQTDRWVGYTYRWNTAQTDAFLVTSEETGAYTVDVGGVPTPQNWLFPSPVGCLSCHTAAAGRVLGARTAQLNRAFAYPGGSDNQLHAWESCLGLFDEPLQSPSNYGAYVDPADGTAALNRRARSYLAANCAHCHAPLGPAPGGMDMRPGTLLGGMNLIGVTPTQGTLGLPNAQRISVGSKEQSVLWARVASTDPDLHMPVGSLVPDPLAISLLGSWIDTGLTTIDSDGDDHPDSADNCPYQANASQSDVGGFLSLTPDGVGDACQCLDVAPLGQLSPSDATRLRTYLAGSSLLVTPGVERRSNDPEPAGRASILDWTKLRRAFAGLSAAPPQVCSAATSLVP